MLLRTYQLRVWQIQNLLILYGPDSREGYFLVSNLYLTKYLYLSKFSISKSNQTYKLNLMNANTQKQL
jgi:hypothetical protein